MDCRKTENHRKQSQFSREVLISTPYDMVEIINGFDIELSYGHYNTLQQQINVQLRLVIHCFVLLQQRQIVCLHLTMVRSTIAHSTLLLPKYCNPTPTCPLLYPDLPTPHPVYTQCHLLYTPPPLIPNTTTLPNPQYQNVSKSIAHSCSGD